eukprot:tig00000157_g9642.t1
MSATSGVPNPNVNSMHAPAPNQGAWPHVQQQHDQAAPLPRQAAPPWHHQPQQPASSWQHQKHQEAAGSWQQQQAAGSWQQQQAAGTGNWQQQQQQQQQPGGAWPLQQQAAAAGSWQQQQRDPRAAVMRDPRVRGLEIETGSLQPQDPLQALLAQLATSGASVQQPPASLNAAPSPTTFANPSKKHDNWTGGLRFSEKVKHAPGADKKAAPHSKPIVVTLRNAWPFTYYANDAPPRDVFDVAKAMDGDVALRMLEELAKKKKIVAAFGVREAFPADETAKTADSFYNFVCSSQGKNGGAAQAQAQAGRLVLYARVRPARPARRPRSPIRGLRGRVGQGRSAGTEQTAEPDLRSFLIPSSAFLDFGTDLIRRLEVPPPLSIFDTSFYLVLASSKDFRRVCKKVCKCACVPRLLRILHHGRG